MVGKMHQKLPEDQEDGKYALLNGSSSHNHRDAKPSPLPGETIESTSDTSSTILTNKPLAKKVRPNFINLKNTSFPATSINGYADEASKVSNKMTSSAINGDCNNSGNIFAESSLSPTSSSVSRSSSNQELTAINGSIPISTLTRPEPSTDPVKDAVLPPKIISRFVSPDAANSPSDSLCSTDSTPWNIDGTETIVENPFKGGKGGAFQGLKKRTPSFIERELSALQEENKQLKASLKEAGRLNGQWRAYHEERQGYVERLLSTIHSLQQRHEPSSSPPGGGQKAAAEGQEDKESQRLKESLQRARAEYQEHVALLQMQVRAHRDDWEAERAEKRMERKSRDEAEEKVNLLMQEVQHLQQKLKVQESKLLLCSRCGGTRDTSAFLPPAATSDTLNQAPVIGQLEYHRQGTYNGHDRAIPTHSHGKCYVRDASPASKQSSRDESSGVYHQGMVQQPAAKSSNESGGSGRESLGQLHSENVISNAENAKKYQSKIEDRLPKVANSSVAKSSECDARTRNDHNLSYTNGTSQVPLKGWIPVSLMHHIAFGEVDDQKTAMYKKSPQMHLVNESQSPIVKNFSPPTRSRESSLASCSSPENELDRSRCSHNRNPGFHNHGYNFTGARPKTNTGQPKAAYDDERRRNAKHRARNILAHALPISPVSSGPNTPSSSVPRPYVPPVLAEKSHPPEKSEFNSILMQEGDFQKTQKAQGTAVHSNCGHNYKSSNTSSHNSNSPRPGTNFQPCIIQIKEISNSKGSNSDVHTSSIMKPDEPKMSASNKLPKAVPTYSSKTLSDCANNQKAPMSSDYKPTIGNSSQAHQGKCTPKNYNNLSNPAQTCTSTETSRSSSPGMSLTTFALTSEGRGVPGAICFSLHPDITPSMKAEISSPKSPKKETTISEVHIQPVSPRPNRSPIEISTKEHWWSVTEEHFTYPEELNCGTLANGTLVNSAYVTLQDNGRKDHFAEQRTARVVSSLELPHQRKTSSEELARINENKNCNNGSMTNMATLSFTPAVNSPTPSPNFSSVESSKANSPPMLADSHLRSMASKNIASAIISYEIAAKGDRIVYSDRLKPTDVVVTNPNLERLSKKISSPVLAEKVPQRSPSAKNRSVKNEGKNQTKASDRNQSNDIQSSSMPVIRQGKGGSYNYPDGIITYSCKEIICPSCQMIFTKDQHIMFLDHFEECTGPEFVDM